MSNATTTATTDKALPLEIAERYAKQIVEWLAPFCERIEVAGSVRRGRPMVNDLDLVVIPKLVEVREGLFQDVVGMRRPLHDELLRYVRANMPAASWRSGAEPKPEAENYMLSLRRCDLDIFIADERTFATRLLCRTGSKEHNIWLAQRAVDRGAHWNPSRGVTVGGQLIEAVTEIGIYDLLGLPFIEPCERESACLQRRFER